jgi:hypothetical protein
MRGNRSSFSKTRKTISRFERPARQRVDPSQSTIRMRIWIRKLMKNRIRIGRPPVHSRTPAPDQIPNPNLHPNHDPLLLGTSRPSPSREVISRPFLALTAKSPLRRPVFVYSIRALIEDFNPPAIHSQFAAIFRVPLAMASPITPAMSRSRCESRLRQIESLPPPTID